MVTEKGAGHIIVVVRGGLVQDVYADSKYVSVDVLDFDNMEACDLEEPDGRSEHASYEKMERQIKEEKLHCVW